MVSILAALQFVWEPPPPEPKRGGVLARQVLQQRAQPPVRVMLSPSPSTQTGQLQKAELVMPAQPAEEDVGTQAAQPAAAAPAVAQGAEPHHDVTATIHSMFGEEDQQPAAAPAGAPETADSTPTAEAAAPAVPDAAAEQAAEGAAATITEETSAQTEGAQATNGVAEKVICTLGDVLQLAAGAVQPQEHLPQAAAEAAAAVLAAAEAACAGPPYTDRFRAHQNQPGPLDGVLHSALSTVFSAVPKAWQPAVGRAVGAVEGHLVGLLHYLLKVSARNRRSVLVCMYLTVETAT